MSTDRPSPTPEHFLTLIRQQQRGRLKIYLGFAAGVGKTYEMLQEGQRLKRRGVDVVIGVVETHGRADTAAQVGDLEQVPRKQIEYRGVVLHEMDLDALLGRHPAVALVDELAHTNAPESRNAKRYQDVEELLRKGAPLADRLSAPWYAVYIQTPQEDLTRIQASVQRQISNTLELVQQLGGTPMTFKGSNVVATIAAFAREYGITQIVIGRTRRLWFRRWFGRSVLDRLLHELPNVDVLVAGVAVALILGTVASIWQARKAISERDEKVIALEDAREAQDAANNARLELERFNERLNSSTVLLASGRTHADAQRWYDAYEAHTEAAEVLPKYFLVWLERGRLNAKLGRWDSAAADFAKAVSIGCPVEQAELSGVPQLLFYAGESTAYEQLSKELRRSERDDPTAVAIRGLLVGDLHPSTALPPLRYHLCLHFAQWAS